MKKSFIILYLFLLICSLNGSDAQLIRNIEIKETARKIIKLPTLSTFFVQDPSIVNLVKSEEQSNYILLGLSVGNSEIICKNRDGSESILKIKVVPKYWNTLKFLFADNPNIQLNITDGHVIISGKVIQNSVMKKVNQAVELDKKRIINNVVLSHTDLLARIENYLKSEKLDNLKPEVMDRTVYLTGKIFDSSRRKKLLSVVESYTKPAGFNLNSSGIILGGSPLTVQVRFVSVTRGKNDNMGLTMDEIKYSMEFNPSASHSYDSSATPNVTKKAAYGGSGEVQTSGVFNTQKIKNAMKVLFDSKLSTRSGELAKLQRGGTVYEKIEGVQAVDLKEIDYGFMVEITPTMINEKTITADVSVQVSGIQQDNPLTISKYDMSAKYTIAPGEVILINKMNAINDIVSEQGIMGLSDIPYIGSMFNNNKAKTHNADILLLLRISFQSSPENKKDADKATDKFEQFKKKTTNVDMNFSDKQIKKLIEKVDKL